MADAVQSALSSIASRGRNFIASPTCFFSPGNNPTHLLQVQGRQDKPADQLPHGPLLILAQHGGWHILDVLWLTLQHSQFAPHEVQRLQKMLEESTVSLLTALLVVMRDVKELDAAFYHRLRSLHRGREVSLVEFFPLMSCE